jgi:hypothetical protein
MIGKNSFINTLYNFLNPQKEAKKLYEEIGRQKLQIQQLYDEYKKLSDWNDQYSDILKSVTNSINALVWRKDKDNKYILANHNHCKFFFGLTITEECLDYIKGKTDYELIKMSYFDHNLKNTFATICETSDNFVKENKRICHFLEAGVIEDEEILLYIMKNPIFNKDEEYLGSIGMGWNCTEQSEFFLNLLKKWIDENKAFKIYKEKDVFCYEISPEANTCRIFKHICPRSDEDITCENSEYNNQCWKEESEKQLERVKQEILK